MAPTKPPTKIGPLERAVYNVAVAQGGTLALHAVYQYGHRPLQLLVEAGAFAKDARGFHVAGALPPTEPPPEPRIFAVNVRVPPSLGEKLVKAHTERGENMTDFVEWALRKALDDLGKERAGSQAPPNPRRASGTRPAVRPSGAPHRKKAGGEK